MNIISEYRHSFKQIKEWKFLFINLIIYLRYQSVWKEVGKNEDKLALIKLGI